MMLTNFVGKGFIVTRASQLRALARRFFDRQARAPPGLSSTSERAALPALPSLPPSSSRADRPGARAPAPSPPPDRRAGAARPERQPEEGRAWRSSTVQLDKPSCFPLSRAVAQRRCRVLLCRSRLSDALRW
ncbi:unnamed protein product, partial [Prorocentrum cordatum]